jgi:hypothetical protein
MSWRACSISTGNALSKKGQLLTEPPVFAGSNPEAQKNSGRKKRVKRPADGLNLSLLPQGKEED